MAVSAGIMVRLSSPTDLVGVGFAPAGYGRLLLGILSLQLQHGRQTDGLDEVGELHILRESAGRRAYRSHTSARISAEATLQHPDRHSETYDYS